MSDAELEMARVTPPVCPHCAESLEAVLDLPYGYWEWDGFEYKHRATATGVDVPEFACANCLGGVVGFHPAGIPGPFGVSSGVPVDGSGRWQQ